MIHYCMITRHSFGPGIFFKASGQKGHIISNNQYTRRPQNLIPADVSKNVLTVHNATVVYADQPSWNPVKRPDKLFRCYEVRRRVDV